MCDYSLLLLVSFRALIESRLSADWHYILSRRERVTALPPERAGATRLFENDVELKGLGLKDVQ